ncbi:hypothetical protein CXB51_022276 [Gossypium anomalum]|uniref:Hydroxyproline-rich glycoprotein family protein n=1 Tax=Gossypium anomalum TaxID=47600 RepID=A0A8J5YH08_9ROSI|nr:hypothetical protein CXB51_022276 [Gossypium anomalum]
MPPICCGLSSMSMLFGSKSVKLAQRLKTYPKSMVDKNSKKTMRSRFKKDSSSQTPCNFILIMELRKKVVTFRDIIDLPPCSTSVSTNQLLLATLRDLQKFYPGSLPHFHKSELKRLPLDKALQELGDNTSKMNDERINKNKYDIYKNDNCKNVDKLIEFAMAELNVLIKMAREQFDIAAPDDEGGGNKGLDPKTNSFKEEMKKSCSKISSGCPSPTSVIPEVATDEPNSSSVTFSFRVQSVGKLNSTDVKRLKLHMFPSFGLQLPSCLNPKKIASVGDINVDDEEKEKKEAKGDDGSLVINAKEKKEAKGDDGSLVINSSIVDKDEGHIDENKRLKEPVSSDDNTKNGNDGCNDTKLAPTTAEVSPSPAPSAEVSSTIPSPPPPPPASLQPKEEVVSGGPPLPPPPKLEPKEPEVPKTETAIPPPPPPLGKSTSDAPGGPPPSPPPVPSASGGGAAPPPAPSLSRTLTKKFGPTPPPPPPGTQANGGANPPPPPPPGGKSVRTKKGGTRLKRSSHMGNLYRNLKSKVEGSPMQGKAFGKKKGGGGGVKNNNSGQGMADALAEITKKSAYFQQIEEDVEKYSKSIYELKGAIGKFKTKDMNELLQFYKEVESVLENLTDETQVLARIEDFPTKKLEALRTSSTLYSKLESMIKELKNLKIDPPLPQLLDKVSRSFTKIKGDIDALERTKDEEAKIFKGYNIEFDFQIIMRIKETMVDVSSDCMELALKERREGDGQNKNGGVKLLWRVFQFAFQVYTFAGGHDDRAEKLTQELAQEIEKEAENQNEATPTPRRRKNKPRRMASRKNTCPTCKTGPT